MMADKLDNVVNIEAELLFG